VRVGRLLPALAVPVLMLAACGDADDDSPEPADEQPEDVPEDLDDDEMAELEDEMAAGEDELTDVPPPEVALLDAGDDPQAPMRLSLDEGDEMDTTLSITSEQAAEGMEDQPPISQTIDLTLTVSELADGQATVDFEFTDASAEGMPEGQPDQSEQLIGLEGQMVLDDRSRVVAATQTAQGLDEVLIPFPEEEVGPGARWEVVTESTPEFPVTETLTVELVEFDGQQYQLDVTVASEELEEPVEQEGMPGQEMTIRDLTIAGEGEVQGALTDIFPTTASLVNETTAVIDLGEEMGGEQTQETRSELTVGEQ
jgi:hypothetical protein